MEVRGSIPERTILCVEMLTVESADRALMTVSIEIIAGTWLRTAHRTAVRLEVMLILGPIHRVQLHPVLPRGTNSTP